MIYHDAPPTSVQACCIYRATLEAFNRDLNEWLEEHNYLDIIDIKYNKDTTGYSALVLYKYHDGELSE